MEAACSAGCSSMYSPQILSSMFGSPLFRTPGINPNAPQPGVTPNTPEPRWLQGLNSPMGQIGLQILANSGPGVRLGQAAGRGVLGYQQQQAANADDDLRKRYMEAQIKAMGLPSPSAPVVVTGPDGKPRYATREEAIGQQPYMEPPGAPSNSAGSQEYELAKSTGFKGSYLDFIEERARRAGSGGNEPMEVVQLPDGRSVYLPRSQVAGMQPGSQREGAVPTEGERTSANYLGRMEAAESKLGGYKPGLMDYIAAEKWMEGGSLTASAASAAMSVQGSKYYQAAADWVRAKLRKESGAVISPQEMVQEIRTYFPMPGDGKDVIEQKRLARLQAQQGMRDMSGRAGKKQDAEVKNPDDPLGIR